MYKSKSLYIALALTVFFNAVSSLEQTAFATSVYAQINSEKSQFADAINKDTLAEFKMQTSYLENIDWNSKENKLIIKEDGLYFIMAVAQVGAHESGPSISEAGGDIFFWFVLNDKEITDSAATLHVVPQSKSNTIVDEYILPLQTGDTLSFMFSTTEISIGLVTFQGTELRPRSPGLTVSVFKVGEVPKAITSAAKSGA